VLQKVTVNGQDEWRPTTISAASCCDCKVKAGSQAHHLVRVFWKFYKFQILRLLAVKIKKNFLPNQIRK